MKNITCLILIVLPMMYTSQPAGCQQDPEGTGGKISLSLTEYAMLREIAALRNDLLAAKRKRLENVSLANQMKTAGIIGELLDRAEQKVLGMLPKGRYGWSWAGFDDPQGMVDLASGFLAELSSGRDPLAGKFAEPGMYTVDHAILKQDDGWHLIYIRGIAATNWPEYPLSNFGHAVSHDLVNWHIRKPVLETPASGFDVYQVWAPHIIKHDGKYWMFYAGVNDSATQAICLATSVDLYHWERHEGNPLITSLPWGNWDTTQWSDCRDPMVLKEGGTFYCYYTAARTVPGSGDVENCLGIASSMDLIHWKDEGYRRLIHTLKTPPESPFVVKRNGEYYLFYTNYKYGIVYVRSPDPLNGWKEDPEDPHSIMEGVSATEIFEHEGKWYITLISHMPYGLHFLEIRELVWKEDGSVATREADL
jgi:arabinan endo-1,5-alpha-L-arabinosidase